MLAFKKIILSLIIISTIQAVANALLAQQIVQPTIDIKTKSFAIIVDQDTYHHCQKDILAYRDQLQRDGLPSFIIQHKWANPDQIRKEIKKLYTDSRLEGIVLIGDIPIAMIRKAQHLATAFKMDEKLAIKESSIPSDRFYDDFNLSFDFLEQSKTNKNLFFYNLSANSANSIKTSIYSGRIKPIKTAGKDPYQQISLYLQKVVKQKQNPDAIDHVMTYLGDGTLSNSLSAWSPEMYRLEEQFPKTFVKSTQAQAIRFDSWPFPKTALINQFRRKDLDIAFIHGHGTPQRIYISGDYPTEVSKEHIEAIQHALKKQASKEVKKDDEMDKFFKAYAEKYHLNKSILDGYNSTAFKERDSIRNMQQGIDAHEVDSIKPNVTLVVFDACYNGDFREDDYMAGRFIFAPGQTVVALANTVSILQDVNTPHLIGSLAMGVCVGRWAQYNQVLESHTIGDPTFTFKHTGQDTLTGIVRESDNKKLIAALGKVKSTEAKNVILSQLHSNGYTDLPKLIEKEFRESNASTTRYTCLHLANLIGGNVQMELLKKGSKDRDEFIRRHSIHTMATIGDPAFIPSIVEAYLENQHASRVLFSIRQGLYAFQKEYVKNIAEQVFSSSELIHTTTAKENFYKEQFKGFYSDMDKDIFDEKSASRKLAISALKNVNYHPSIGKYVEFIRNSKENMELRVAMLESLAWFRHSYRKQEIMNACKELMADTRHAKKLRDEAARTLNILK